MPILNPYLTFKGNCREAMDFYHACLGGELNFLVAGESPLAEHLPAESRDKILHSALKTQELQIMATDMQPTTMVEGNDVHLCLICDTVEETRNLFGKLSAGGKVSQPLSPMFFGLIGTLTDKFGKRWMLECDKQ